MARPPPLSVVCPTLVGRQPHLNLLGRLLHQASRGQGSMALVTGEAGVGKSRLLSGVRRLALEHLRAAVPEAAQRLGQVLPSSPYHARGLTGLDRDEQGT